MTVPILTGRDGGTAASARRKRREALGFSQESYADEIGMHRTYYSAIERGDYPCSWIPSSGSAKGCRR